MHDTPAAPATRRRRAAPPATPAAHWCVGVVTARRGERFAVVSGAQALQLQRAVGCLLEPRPGDTVACLHTEAGGEGWVMAVLTREPANETDGPHRVSLPGDTELSVGRGRLSLQATDLALRADQGLSVQAHDARLTVDSGEAVARQWRMSAGVMKLVGSLLSTVVDRAQHFSRHHLRRTEGLDRVHATHLDCEAEQLLRLSGEHALVNGEKLVKARGAQIHFG
jgi:hypothetical protein